MTNWEEYGARVLAAIDAYDGLSGYEAQVAADRATVRDCLDGLRVHDYSDRHLDWCRAEDWRAAPCPDTARYAAILTRIGQTYGETL